MVVQRSDITLAVVTMTVRTPASRLELDEARLCPAALPALCPPADALALALGLLALLAPALADGFAAELWPPAAADPETELPLGFDAVVEPDALASM